MIKKKTNMFTLDEKQHTQQTLTLPSSFLGSAFSGCHNIGNFWDNPKGAGIVYKAAAPARCLLNQNKIHSAQTLVHSWMAQDNLKQAGWALVKYSAGPHAACDLSCYRSLSPSLSLSVQTVFSASVFPSLCLFSASCGTSSWPLCSRLVCERKHGQTRGAVRKQERVAVSYFSSVVFVTHTH